MIKVVHPAYHAFPNGGHPSFCPSGKRRLSCVLVFATEGDCQSGFASTDSSNTHSAGYVIAVGLSIRVRDVRCSVGDIPISTAPAVEPAIIERSALGYIC